MCLRVIGAGMGRTGTLSLKLALEELGLGPCHHMEEVLANPAQAAQWHAAACGETVDWDAVLRGYNSAVDWPTAYFWRALAEHYPDAKIVLTLRDADAWYDSMSKTSLPALNADEAPPPLRPVIEMAHEVVQGRTFGGRLAERDHAIAVYKKHVAAVQAALSPARLLSFKVAEGWGPLCKFLGRPEPAAPFPRTNSTAEFSEKLKG